MKYGFATLAIELGTDGQLPTEFRLFTPGWNETEKGRFLFDAKAAACVMAANNAWGVDRMIDLEHQSLSGEIPAEPTARDARGWCKLELRPDGSLWAVSVKWTKDGAERLTQRRQRYVSPAFAFDPATKRITKVVNVAICSIPATHQTPALVAASHTARLAGGNAMTLEEFLKVVKALGIDMSTSLDDAMAKIKGEGDADGDGPPSSEAPPADGAPAAAAATPPPPPGSKKEEKPAEVAASIARLMRLSNADSFVGAVVEAEAWRESHLELETERQKLAAERATLENAERRKLCAELVTLGAEFPSTVWADDKGTTMKPRWEKMELAELRTHTAEQRIARGGSKKRDGAPKTPLTVVINPSVPTVASLTAEELAICKAQGCEPEIFAALKAQRDSVKTGGN